jgi:hypothetical protein
MFVWNSEKNECLLHSDSTLIIRNKKYENTIQLKIRDTAHVTFLWCSYTNRRDCTKSQLQTYQENCVVFFIDNSNTIVPIQLKGIMLKLISVNNELIVQTCQLKVYSKKHILSKVNQIEKKTVQCIVCR